MDKFLLVVVVDYDEFDVYVMIFLYVVYLDMMDMIYIDVDPLFVDDDNDNFVPIVVVDAFSFFGDYDILDLHYVYIQFVVDYFLYNDYTFDHLDF